MKKAIYFILFLLLMSFAYAVPPVQTVTQSTEQGYLVEADEQPYIKISTSGEFVVHVVNLSNGILVFKEVTCKGHLFDKNGSIIIEQIALQEDDYFKFSYNTSFMKEPGLYSYTVHCNNSLRGGSLQGYMEATLTGYSNDKNYVPLIIVVSFFTLMLIITITLTIISQTNTGKIVFGLISSLLFMLNNMFMYLIVQRMNVKSIVDLLEPLYHLSVLSMRYVLIAVVLYLVYATINMFFSKKDRGTNLDRELGEI